MLSKWWLRIRLAWYTLIGQEYTWVLSPTREYNKDMEFIDSIYKKLSINPADGSYQVLDPTHTIYDIPKLGPTQVWVLKKVHKGYNRVWQYQGESYRVASNQELKEKYRKGWEDTRRKVLEELHKDKSVH